MRDILKATIEKAKAILFGCNKPGGRSMGKNRRDKLEALHPGSTCAVKSKKSGETLYYRKPEFKDVSIAKEKQANAEERYSKAKEGTKLKALEGSRLNKAASRVKEIIAKMDEAKKQELASIIEAPPNRDIFDVLLADGYGGIYAKGMGAIKSSEGIEAWFLGTGRNSKFPPLDKIPEVVGGSPKQAKFAQDIFDKHKWIVAGDIISAIVNDSRYREEEKDQISPRFGFPNPLNEVRLILKNSGIVFSPKDWACFLIGRGREYLENVSKISVDDIIKNRDVYMNENSIGRFAMLTLKKFMSPKKPIGFFEYIGSVRKYDEFFSGPLLPGSKDKIQGYIERGRELAEKAHVPEKLPEK